MASENQKIVHVCSNLAYKIPLETFPISCGQVLLML